MPVSATTRGYQVEGIDPMEEMTRTGWNPSRRCSATARSGEQCWRQPIPGGHVCVVHGGAAPQVKKTARARLLEGADFAIDYLLNMLTPRAPCEHCGRSDADRDPVVVKACQLVLDRSGFHPSLTVQHVEAPDKFEGMNIDQVIEYLEAMLDNARDIRAAERAVLPAIDATVLTTDDGVDVEDDAYLLDPSGDRRAGDPNPLEIDTAEKWTGDAEASR